MKETTEIGSRVFRRDRMSQLIEATAEGTPLVIVSAPSGYGKSTALVSHLYNSEWDYVPLWLTMTEVHNHPGHFWRHFRDTLLAAGLERAFEDVEDLNGATVAEILHALEKSLDDLKEKLREEKRWGKKSRIAVVLDDFHLISGKSIIDAVEDIAAMGMYKLKLFVVSREIPPFTNKSKSLKKKYGHLSEAGLAFTRTEAREWLAWRGEELDETGLDSLMERTGGQIGGMYLYASHASKELAAPLSIEEILEKLLMSRHDERTRRFLSDISCLDEYPLALCSAVTGYGEDEVEALLWKASGENHFVQLAQYGFDNREIRYSLHHIFRGFLRRRMIESNREEYCRNLRVAGDWYFRQRTLYSAASCYMRAENHEKLISVLTEILADERGLGMHFSEFKHDVYLFRGRLFDAIPLDMIRARAPMLELFNLILLIQLRDAEKLAAAKASIRAYYESQPDSDVKRRILGELLLIDTMDFFDDLKAKDEAMSKAYELLQGPSLFTTPGAPVIFGVHSLLLLYYKGDRLLGEIVAGYVAHWQKHNPGVLNGLMSGLPELLQAEVAYERGNFKEARFDAKDCLAATDQHSIVVTANFLLAKLCVENGDLDGCFKHMKAIMKAAQVERDPQFSTMGYCYGVLGAMIMEERFVPEWLAVGDLEKSRNVAAGHGIRLETFPYTFWLAMTERYKELERILPAIRTEYQAIGERMGVLYCLLYETMILRAKGDIDGTRVKLREAWEAAAPDGLVMPFVERSARIFPIVQEILLRGDTAGDGAFHEWLRSMAERMKRRNRAVMNLRKKYHDRVEKLPDASSPLLPRFSRRELEVRDMLQRGMTRREIREELGISGDNLNMIIWRMKIRSEVGEPA